MPKTTLIMMLKLKDYKKMNLTTVICRFHRIWSLGDSGRTGTVVLLISRYYLMYLLVIDAKNKPNINNPNIVSNVITWFSSGMTPSDN